MGRKRKRFYTREEFSKVKDVKKAVIDTSCIVIKRKSDDIAGCINRRITDNIVALAKFITVEKGGDAFSANIPSSLAEEIGLSEDRVIRYAIESAQKKNPPEIVGNDGDGYILHTHKAYGAGVLLYDDVLPFVARALNDDYYIFPASEDYLKVVRKSGISLPEARRHIASDGGELLSNDVFVYYRDHDLVRLIGDNDQNVIYLQKGVMLL